MILLLLLAASAPLDSLYQAGEYERVIQLAPALLADSARSPADSSAINRARAFALVALGRTDEAAAVFRLLIAGNPTLALDPGTVSPKIRAVFEGVRAQMVVTPAPLAVAPVETVYRRQPTPLTVLVPGLQQVRAGRRGVGYALAGATALSLAGLALGHFEYNNARAGYLKATSQQEITDRYHVAANWSHARIVLSGTTAVCWLIGLITALRSP